MFNIILNVNVARFTHDEVLRDAVDGVVPQVFISQVAGDGNIALGYDDMSDAMGELSGRVDGERGRRVSVASITIGGVADGIVISVGEITRASAVACAACGGDITSGESGVWSGAVERDVAG